MHCIHACSTGPSTDLVAVVLWAFVGRNRHWAARSGPGGVETGERFGDAQWQSRPPGYFFQSMTAAVQFVTQARRWPVVGGCCSTVYQDVSGTTQPESHWCHSFTTPTRPHSTPLIGGRQYVGSVPRSCGLVWSSPRLIFADESGRRTGSKCGQNKQSRIQSTWRINATTGVLCQSIFKVTRLSLPNELEI